MNSSREIVQKALWRSGLSHQMAGLREGEGIVYGVLRARNPGSDIV